jgi:hypothetical protein
MTDSTQQIMADIQSLKKEIRESKRKEKEHDEQIAELQRHQRIAQPLVQDGYKIRGRLLANIKRDREGTVSQAGRSENFSTRPNTLTSTTHSRL